MRNGVRADVHSELVKGCTAMKTTVKTATATLTSRVVVGTLLIAILAAAAPTIANAMATDTALPFTTSLTAAPAPVKFVLATSNNTALSTESAMAQASVPVVSPTTTTATQVTASGTTTTKTAVKNRPASTDAARAKAILAGLIAKHPILRGTTVTMGDARGYQAIALYKSGRIIISPTHTASLERILNHEIWHIIDWRDNNRIDWGEQVPPK